MESQLNREVHYSALGKWENIPEPFPIIEIILYCNNFFRERKFSAPRRQLGSWFNFIIFVSRFRFNLLRIDLILPLSIIKPFSRGVLNGIIFTSYLNNEIMNIIFHTHKKFCGNSGLVICHLVFQMGIFLYLYHSFYELRNYLWIFDDQTPQYLTVVIIVRMYSHRSNERFKKPRSNIMEKMILCHLGFRCPKRWRMIRGCWRHSTLISLGLRITSWMNEDRYFVAITDFSTEGSEVWVQTGQDAKINF